MNADVSKYLTQQVMTASPASLVSMLYDKAILSLKDAITSIEKGEIEGRWRANAKATEIITHMWSTLNIDRGGEIAGNLDDLFSFILSRLPEIDLKNDPEPAREVIALLEPLRESWRELKRRENGPAQTAAAGTYGADQPTTGDTPPTRLPTSLSA